jgi:hypothetical protein
MHKLNNKNVFVIKKIHALLLFFLFFRNEIHSNLFHLQELAHWNPHEIFFSATHKSSPSSIRFTCIESLTSFLNFFFEIFIHYIL